VHQETKDLPHWVMWRMEPGKKGKPTKVSYIAEAVPD
jgi:hypothetical protein